MQLAFAMKVGVLVLSPLSKVKGIDWDKSSSRQRLLLQSWSAARLSWAQHLPEPQTTRYKHKWMSHQEQPQDDDKPGCQVTEMLPSQAGDGTVTYEGRHFIGQSSGARQGLTERKVNEHFRLQERVSPGRWAGQS